MSCMYSLSAGVLIIFMVSVVIRDTKLIEMMYNVL